MGWFHELQFISAVSMPEALADAYGTTINGMWAAPEQRADEYIAGEHAKGNRVLFSVPLIALTPKVYTEPAFRYLIDEACCDIEGNPSLVPWYYWESMPVYSICFYSSSFRSYLLERCKTGIRRGMDVVDLDEINTSLGLMNRKPGGSGFCGNCLDRFRAHVRRSPEVDQSLAELDDASLRQKLRADDDLYEQYHRFHGLEAYAVVVEFVQELREFAKEHNPDFAITANLAYLGNLVPVHGDLWGLMWGELIDFVMMENIYQPERDGPHMLLPRGKFSAWYRLGSAFTSRAPVWICPSINIPKQMAGEKRLTYYTLMFLEAYASGGRWGYYWWPGVDVETRVKATAPEQIKNYTRLFKQHREYFEDLTTDNTLAVLYLNSSMRARPEAHFKYLALAQALSEMGFQFDVVYGGDGVYTTDALDLDRLSRYKVVLLPEADHLTASQAETLTRYTHQYGCKLIQFAQNPAQPSLRRGSIFDEQMLFRFWKDYRDEDRQRIADSVGRQSALPIRTSCAAVSVTRYTKADDTVLHFINYSYDAVQDTVAAVENLNVRIPWEGKKEPVLRWISLEGIQQYPCRRSQGELVFTIPRLEMYGLAVLS